MRMAPEVRKNNLLPIFTSFMSLSNMEGKRAKNPMPNQMNSQMMKKRVGSLFFLNIRTVTKIAIAADKAIMMAPNFRFILSFPF